MTRHFCDRCGKELTPGGEASRDQQGRLFGRIEIPGGRTMFVQVISGTNSTWNDGEYCNVCIATCLQAALDSKAASAIAPEHFVCAPQEA